VGIFSENTRFSAHIYLSFSEAFCDLVLKIDKAFILHGRTNADKAAPSFQP